MENNHQGIVAVGDIGKLKVKEVKKFGAFLEWQPDQDVLLPKSEITTDLIAGKTYLVAIQNNPDTNKPYATMKLYDLLKTDPPYQKNDVTTGTVYSINKDFGVFIAVENAYHGLLLNKEVFKTYSVGDTLEVRIKNIREDGKLELSTRQQVHHEIEVDAKKILELLKSNQGFLALNDHSSPEEIKQKLAISKKAFKRATGRLLKEGVIEMDDKGITLSWEKES